MNARQRLLCLFVANLTVANVIIPVTCDHSIVNTKINVEVTDKYTEWNHEYRDCGAQISSSESINFGRVKVKNIYYFIESNIGSIKNEAIVSSLRTIKYFLPWINFIRTESNKICTLCFYNKSPEDDNNPNASYMHSTKNYDVIVADCMDCTQTKYLGSIQKYIFLVLGLNHAKCDDLEINSILCEKSADFDYPIYYTDIEYMAKLHYGYMNSKRVIAATNAVCNFIKSPYIESKSRRLETFDLFQKYKKRYKVYGFDVMSTRSYDPFMFLFSYTFYKNMMTYEYNTIRYNSIIINEFASEIKQCNALFDEYNKIDSLYRQKMSTQTKLVTSTEPNTSSTTLQPELSSIDTRESSTSISMETPDDVANQPNNIDVEDDYSGSGDHMITTETTETTETTTISPQLATSTQSISYYDSVDAIGSDYDYGYDNENDHSIVGSGDGHFDDDDEDVNNEYDFNVKYVDTNVSNNTNVTHESISSNHDEIITHESIAAAVELEQGATSDNYTNEYDYIDNNTTQNPITFNNQTEHEPNSSMEHVTNHTVIDIDGHHEHITNHTVVNGHHVNHHKKCKYIYFVSTPIRNNLIIVFSCETKLHNGHEVQRAKSFV